MIRIYSHHDILDVCKIYLTYTCFHMVCLETCTFEPWLVPYILRKIIKILSCLVLSTYVTLTQRTMLMIVNSAKQDNNQQLSPWPGSPARSKVLLLEACKTAQ